MKSLAILFKSQRKKINCNLFTLCWTQFQMRTMHWLCEARRTRLTASRRIAEATAVLDVSAIAVRAISNHEPVGSFFSLRAFQSVQLSNSCFSPQLHTQARACFISSSFFSTYRHTFWIRNKRKRKKKKHQQQRKQIRKMNGKSNSGYGYLNSKLTNQCDDGSATNPTTEIHEQWVWFYFFRSHIEFVSKFRRNQFIITRCELISMNMNIWKIRAAANCHLSKFIHCIYVALSLMWMKEERFVLVISFFFVC